MAAPNAPRTDPPAPQASPRRRRRALPSLILILLLLVALGAVYVWGTLRFAYADGERAGFVQKFSRKGWLCKTWEGELAMVNLPGTVPQIFPFTVRDAALAASIERTMGQQVALHYEQHKGIPSRCFGETEYFVTGVRPVQQPRL